MATISSYETAKGKRYRVRYRTPDHRQTDKRGFRTKREADLFAASVEVSKARGEYIEASAARITVGELAGPWLAVKEVKLKPSAYRPLEIAWRVYVEPRWGATAVADVRHSDVAVWVSELHNGTAVNMRSPRRRVTASEAKPKSASTVKRAFGVLASILDVAVKDRRIVANAARGVDNLPRKTSKAHVYLTHEQVSALATAAGDEAGMVLTLAYCGIRWGELAGLRVRDVNTVRRRLSIRENAVMVGRTIEVGSPKSHERRDVSYPALLDPYLRQAMRNKLPDALLFPAPLGGHMTRPNTSEGTTSWFTRALASAGLPRMVIHDLRHTAASLAISSGANVKAVQRMLGHASAAMTLDVYADLFEDDLDGVSIALNQAASAAGVGKVWALVKPESPASA
ncbi:site-specific integrase [Microbacterium sp. cx-55]|uniref:site-specific integrase n=1 Tax=Microbacterium sp. cx-55 TaxID=2875948 RepID=UPI001CC0EAA6|nr:site-specific integrase [Microbacterium sp. cx-55]MBZ4485981.1 site-specific integrase [Microbacterium sp. cx-55]UGB34145.1 site-specific integrase [Microbacterium sp. cx-55]